MRRSRSGLGILCNNFLPPAAFSQTVFDFPSHYVAMCLGTIRCFTLQNVL